MADWIEMGVSAHARMGDRQEKGYSDALQSTQQGLGSTCCGNLLRPDGKPNPDCNLLHLAAAC